MQAAALRQWPADAVHDTVAAVFRTAPFQRDLQATLLARLVRWLGEAFAWIARTLEGLPGGRSAVVWITALVCVAIAARLLIAARLRDPAAPSRGGPRRAARGQDPWLAAERLAASGDHGAAAHLLYRGVLESLARDVRMRLDPSRTSGDYARELRRTASDVEAIFRAFAQRFDDVVYGHSVIGASEFADLLRLATPLRTRARAA